jgi:alpha-tubulin suppressor-like RCC1 family protein
LDAATDAVERDPVVQISAGYSAACARTASGRLYCWGKNEAGTVGDGTTNDRAVATPVTRDATGSPLGPVAEVAMGNVHACARTIDGSVYCWGSDDFGEVGDGRVSTDFKNVLALRPTKIALQARGTSQLALGSLTSCLLDDIESTAHVTCWGSNSSGVLGHLPGTQGDIHLPVPEWANPNPSAGPSIPSAIQLAVGTDFACALTRERTVWCWGSNGDDRLGVPNVSASTTPLRVADGNGGAITLVGVEEVRAADHAACARSAPGVVCWGLNLAGAFGNAPVGASLPALALATTSTVTGLYLGLDTTCITRGAGALCWGNDYAGELGRPSPPTCASSGGPCDPNPGYVVSADASRLDVVSLAPGAGFMCGLTSDGGVWCWGDDSHGQLGDDVVTEGLIARSNPPTRVIGLP